MTNVYRHYCQESARYFLGVKYSLCRAQIGLIYGFIQLNFQMIIHNGSPLLKGALSRRFLRFGVKCTFLRARDTPRKSREGNLLIFSKEEQTIISYGRFFTKQRQCVKKSARCFQVAAIRLLAIRSQTYLIIVSENWLGSFKRN